MEGDLLEEVEDTPVFVASLVLSQLAPGSVKLSVCFSDPHSVVSIRSGSSWRNERTVPEGSGPADPTEHEN